MYIQLAILFVLAGLAIGSFLNVCIDRLPPKRFFFMTNDKGERLEIGISNKVYSEDMLEAFKDRDVYITGKIFKNTTTGVYQLYVSDDTQISLEIESITNAKVLAVEDVKNEAGNTVTVGGRITEEKTVKNSLSKPPSHCDSCGHKLGILDNIPIFSYLLLQGKCRYCKAHIPARVLIVEILTAAIFLIAYWRLGLSAQFAITIFWSCVFIVIIFIDWEQTLILNSMTYTGAIIAVIILVVDSFVPGVSLFGDRVFIPHTSLFSGLISGGVLLLFWLMIIIINPRSMGMGDAKLVALIGLVSGFPLMIFSMLIGIILGGVVAIVLLITGKKKRKDVIPYGTFLAIGPIVAMLLPGGLMDWYMSFGK